MTESATDLSAVLPPKVLIIEDDDDLGRALVEALERSGMRTAWAMTGAEGLSLKRSFEPNIVLVDLTLPDTNGINLVTVIAQQGDCGVIIVSGATDGADRIVGLELGADDFVAKPPHLRELLARIRAVHRRVRLRLEPRVAAARSIVQIGHLRVDLVARTVHNAAGERVLLTGAEFAALEAMVNAQGEPVSRDRICEVALRRPWRVDDRSVDQLIFNLRNKLSESEGRRLIHSIRGAGYMLAVGEAGARGDGHH